MKQCPLCKTEYADDQAFCVRDAASLVDEVAANIQPTDPFIDRTIAEKYRIVRMIGRGGMGAVYEGKHLLLDRTVAIKVLNQNIIDNKRAAARFIREAKASAKIEHPNAVTIHDFGVLKDGSAYLIMEFIRGQSLRQLLSRKSKLDLEQSIEWTAQICSVIEAAHQHGIIHRDLKPENVMIKESLDGSTHIKVVDFGLAKLVSGDGEAATKLTQPGEVLGTPHYMAPEFYEGEIIDKKADIYAIGVIFYEMLTGITPFTGSVQSVIGGHLFKDPKPLFEADKSIPKEINEIVQTALKKNREERISSAVEFSRRLKAAMKTSERHSENISFESQPASAKNSSQIETGNLGLDPLETATGKFDEDGATSGLGEGEARDSAEFQKSGTNELRYDTVATPSKSTPKDLEPPNAPDKGSSALAAPAATAMQKQAAVSTTNKLAPKPESDKPETFFEMISSMKRELVIGSIIVTLLAIALVAFIIYRSRQSTPKAKPLPSSPEQNQSSQIRSTLNVER